MANTAATAAGLAERPSLTLTRRLRARPERVYAAWTEPESLIRWFATSQAKPGSIGADHDVRVGGHYRINFTGESGEYFEVGGVYREVVPNEKLVFTWAWHTMKERESLVTVTIRRDGTGSILTLLHEKFFDEAARDGHKRGWSGSLDKLERLFA